MPPLPPPQLFVFLPRKTLSLEGTHQCLTCHMGSTNNYCLSASFLFSFTLWLLIWVLLSISRICFCKTLPICLPKVQHWSLLVSLTEASHLAFRAKPLQAGGLHPTRISNETTSELPDAAQGKQSHSRKAFSFYWKIIYNSLSLHKCFILKLKSFFFF